MKRKNVFFIILFSGLSSFPAQASIKNIADSEFYQKEHQLKEKTPTYLKDSPIPSTFKVNGALTEVKYRSFSVGYKYLGTLKGNDPNFDLFEPAAEIVLTVKNTQKENEKYGNFYVRYRLSEANDTITTLYLLDLEVMKKSWSSEIGRDYLEALIMGLKELPRLKNSGKLVILADQEADHPDALNVYTQSGFQKTTEEVSFKNQANYTFFEKSF